ncbi:MAG: hypothetical protein ACFFAN_14185 [Promethearchaeota archaeon]
MSFKEKVKEFFENISSKISNLSKQGSAIQHVIDINNRYIESELKLTQDLQDGFIALKNYADTESYELENAISTLKLTFKSIESLRQEKVEKLRENIITPLQEISEGYNTLNFKLKELEKAKRAWEKAKRNFEKKKKTPNPIDIEESQFLLKEAQTEYDTLEEEVAKMTEKFNQEKIDKLYSILKNRVEIEKTFLKKSLEKIETVSSESEDIKGILV